MPTFSQLSTAAGIFAGLALGSTQLGDSEYWPVVVMLTGVPAAAQFILQIFNPESPTYLVVQCKDPEAGKAALRQLASMTDAEAEEATRRIQKDADSSSGQLPIIWEIKKNTAKDCGSSALQKFENSSGNPRFNGIFCG